MRGGGAPRDVRVLARHPLGLHVTRQARRLTRRLASHNAGRSPPGAPPWRFWAPVPRFLLRHLLRIRPASSSQPGRSAWRAGSRASRDDGYESPPRHATPRSTFGIISGDAPQLSKAGPCVIWLLYAVKHKMCKELNFETISMVDENCFGRRGLGGPGLAAGSGGGSACATKGATAAPWKCFEDSQSRTLGSVSKIRKVTDGRTSTKQLPPDKGVAGLCWDWDGKRVRRPLARKWMFSPSANAGL